MSIIRLNVLATASNLTFFAVVVFQRNTPGIIATSLALILSVVSLTYATRTDRR